MNNYEININTVALIAEGDQTVVYEKDRKFLVEENATKIMENSCEYFGSSLTGRQKGTANLIGVTHKAPLIVEESSEIIFFPTSSPRLSSCSWISLKDVDKYYTTNNKLYIRFKSGQEISLNLSYGIMDNQVLRATRLESVLRGRKV